MAAHLGLSNVSFAGYEADVARIWERNHALLLPSRAEGLPLVLVEAMLSGRVPIVTDLAGNAEVVEDGRTGFIAAAASEAALAEAMERAWARRADWPAIGAAAGAAIRELVPPDPPGLLADTLIRMASEPASAIRR